MDGYGMVWFVNTTFHAWADTHSSRSMCPKTCTSGCVDGSCWYKFVSSKGSTKSEGGTFSNMTMRDALPWCSLLHSLWSASVLAVLNDSKRWKPGLWSVADTVTRPDSVWEFWAHPMNPTCSIADSQSTSSHNEELMSSGVRNRWGTRRNPQENECIERILSMNFPAITWGSQMLCTGCPCRMSLPKLQLRLRAVQCKL